MKRDFEHLNLRDAFGEVPEETFNALMDTARSVHEEKRVKRVTYRTLLVAACIMIATLAVAVAAGSIFGWNDFFSLLYGTTVPRAAQEIMETTEKHQFTLGPVTFAVQELYADHHIAMSTMEITMTDGSDALMCMDGDQDLPMDTYVNGPVLAHRLGIDASTSWQDAAKQLQLSLYCVRGILDLEAQYMDGEEMEDVLYNEEGHFVDYSLQLLNGQAVEEELPVQFFLRVAKIDPGTGEATEVLKSQETLSLHVSQTSDTYVYASTEPFFTDGLLLDRVRAERTPAGLYLYADWVADDSITEEEFFEKDLFPVWLDDHGNAYGPGLNLTEQMDIKTWPHITFMRMLTVDEAPDQLTIRMGDDERLLTRTSE